VKEEACALRSFLRYCYLVGLVEHSVSAGALPVSGRRRSLLPKGITSAQAKSLLRACDRRRAAVRRDYAVIVLMLRLGLRSSEVAGLRLDDLDWRVGEVTVHGEGARVDKLPLPVDVGEAVAAYLRRGRPRAATCREVFLSVQAPWDSLTRGGVTGIVARATGRAGIGVVRAHRLRHTAASDTVDEPSALGMTERVRQECPDPGDVGAG
jgi:integrase